MRKLWRAFQLESALLVLIDLEVEPEKFTQRVKNSFFIGTSVVLGKGVSQLTDNRLHKFLLALASKTKVCLHVFFTAFDQLFQQKNVTRVVNQ